MDSNDYEAIFVDDQSTDNSYEILTNYAQQYDFIRCLQLDQNSGSPSEPRNLGMEAAQGKYLTLLDADDWLDSEGMPQLVKQMEAHQSDIGFGQAYSHKDTGITKIGRFASYQHANHLVPYEIYKIFRAVGPPGKVFKRSTVMDHQIKFQHMKYGEDKLFFAEVISLSHSASMSPLAAYHVNRYTENESLIKSTSLLEKAQLNLDVLKKIVDLDIPQSAMKQLLSRVLEMDFISRFLSTKTFLKSTDKEAFYEIFSEVIDVINTTSVDIQELFTAPHFKNVYHLFNSDKSQLETYIKETLVDTKTQKIIDQHVVYKSYSANLDLVEPVYWPCYPVYHGTHKIEDALFDVIQVYKPEHVEISKVLLTKVKDESQSRHIEFTLKDDNILLKHDDLEFDDHAFNIEIIFNDYNSVLVYATHPNLSNHQELRRQNFKIEFQSSAKEKAQKTQALKPASYFTEVPDCIVTQKKVYRYRDADFNDPIEQLQAGKAVRIQAIESSSKGTPRLLTTDHDYITANQKFVTAIDLNELNNYITQVPHKVEIIKKCKLYDSKNFKNEPLQELNVGTQIEITDIEFTNNLTPRLKTTHGLYLTANLKYVKPLS